MIIDFTRRLPRQAFLAPDEEQAYKQAPKSLAFDVGARSHVSELIEDLKRQVLDLRQEEEAEHDRWFSFRALTADESYFVNHFLALQDQERKQRHKAIERRLTKFYYFLNPDEKKQATQFDVPTLKLVSFQELIDTPPRTTSASRLLFLCPFHQEKTPSFVVFNPETKNNYHCFGCQEHGDTLSFVMKQHDLSFKAACQFLSRLVHT